MGGLKQSKSIFVLLFSFTLSTLSILHLPTKDFQTSWLRISKRVPQTVSMLELQRQQPRAILIHM
jgi:hypothetical protein